MEDKTIKEIKQLLESSAITEDELHQLKDDKRKGVQLLLRSYEKKQEKYIQQKLQYEQLVSFDNAYRTNYFQKIAGVDEAGRGPLAGPVVAAAVILPRRFSLIGLNDSKQLTEKQRDRFYDKIIREAESYSIAVIDNHVIDQVNIYQATKKAMIEALTNLDPKPDIALIDAMNIHNFNYPTHSIVKGDETSVSIAAASILAKVTRDRLMNEMDVEFPAYQFKSNKGYGTKDHIEALEQHGVTRYHRRTFAPINKMHK